MAGIHNALLTSGSGSTVGATNWIFDGATATANIFSSDGGWITALDADGNLFICWSKGSGAGFRFIKFSPTGAVLAEADVAVSTQMYLGNILVDAVGNVYMIHGDSGSMQVICLNNTLTSIIWTSNNIHNTIPASFFPNRSPTMIFGEAGYLYCIYDDFDESDIGNVSWLGLAKMRMSDGAFINGGSFWNQSLAVGYEVTIPYFDGTYLWTMLTGLLSGSGLVQQNTGLGVVSTWSMDTYSIANMTPGGYPVEWRATIRDSGGNFYFVAYNFAGGSAYLLKFDSALNGLWARSITGGVLLDSNLGIDPLTGLIYVCFSFGNSIAKYSAFDSSGTHQFSRQVSVASTSEFTGIAITNGRITFGLRRGATGSSYDVAGVLPMDGSSLGTYGNVTYSSISPAIGNMPTPFFGGSWTPAYYTSTVSQSASAAPTISNGTLPSGTTYAL